MKSILLVENDENDIFLVKSACERSGLPHALHITRDGLEAIAYLAGDGAYANRTQYPLPNLVFLDIKMPGMDGHHVLEWIRTQPQFANLPVIMLTTSHAVNDERRAYTLGVTSFLRKWDDVNSFRQGMKITLKYWFGLNGSAK